ncbi:MAG: FecR domain-containing protein [Clostridia bacterium]|nr:FecR domain-containing protein [Clostridia bacterium]
MQRHREYRPTQRPLVVIMALLLALTLCGTALAESYSGSTIRLLRYEGDVEITDPAGSPRFIMPNARFSDGETLKTGPDGSASVSVDDGRILTLDAESAVTFAQSGNSLTLTLSEGSLFLDVAEKLDPGESLDIHTSNMTVGIRGTIVFVSTGHGAASASAGGLEEVLTTEASGGITTRLGVLEGHTEISYVDEMGAAQSLEVQAGQMATLLDENEDGRVDAAAQPRDMQAEDVSAFVAEQIQADPSRIERISDASDFFSRTGFNLFPADGDWSWNGEISIVAQSASKLYDGTALTRRGDILVYGIPEHFSITAQAGGSQTDAGTGSNPISSYAIYNPMGEDVTAHFTNVKTVPGMLVVDPAPLTVWTGSAEKVYDGTPLTNPDAAVRARSGFEASQPVWRNTSYVATESAGQMSASFTSETLYGVSGVTWVHGTNPLTGETQEIELLAGQRMTVYLSDRGGEQSIEFRIEDMSEGDIPDEILRLYADNPDLLRQACADTGWDQALILERASALPGRQTRTAEAGSLYVEEGETQRLMIDATNVRINVDTDITDYNGRALGDEEAHYTPVVIDRTIAVTATGSQLNAGSSPNTYEIDWGSANPNNYVLSEDLGTLTVTPAALTVSTGSASKPYDGTPLTSDEASIRGLVGGETARVSATGTITDVGTAGNTYSISWGDTNPENYTVTASTGTLEVMAAEATITTSTASKPYDGTPLTGEAAATGFAESDGVTVTAVGTITNAGTAVNNYTIDWGSGSASNYTVSEEIGTLTVTPAEATVTTSSASKPYDGTPLTGEATATGFAESDGVTVTAVGTITNAGTAVNNYTIDWGSGSASNYTVTEEIGVLTVTPAKATVTTNSASKPYDGTPLTGEATAVGFAEPDGVTVTATGSITDPGSVTNGYTIDWGSGDPANYAVTETLGTLTVTANDAPITVTAQSFTEVYDGYRWGGWYGLATEGLPAGITNQADPEIYWKDAGTYPLKAAYDFVDGEGNSVNDRFTNVTLVDGTLTVTPASLTVTTGSASKEYDGQPLTCAETKLEGLMETDGAEAVATGTITEVGEAPNTYTIEWGDTNPNNYAITETLGTLTVTPAIPRKVTLTAGSASKTFDGTPLESADVAAEGLPEGYVFEAATSGSQLDAGSTENTISAYFIYDADGQEVTDKFEVTCVPGTLTVNKRAVVISMHGYTTTFNAYPHILDTITASDGATGATIECSAKATYSSYGEYADGSEVTVYLNDGLATFSFDSYINVGTYTVTPVKQGWTATPTNYTVTFTDNTLVITEKSYGPDPEPTEEPDPEVISGPDDMGEHYVDP